MKEASKIKNEKEQDLESIRKDFPGLNKYIYLNSAAVGLLPRQTIRAINSYLDDERIYGAIHWSDWEKKIEDLRGLISRLIGSTPAEVAFVQNTSMGLSVVANGIKWKRGDNIVLNNMEFPANIYPWQIQAKKHSLEIRLAKSKDGVVPVDEYERLVDDNTRVVAISWVEFQNGFTHNLKEIAAIAHSHNAYLVVDGIQGVGALKLDVRKEDIDFLACGGSKWLISPIGTGFLFVKQELLDEIDVAFAGWRAHKNPENFSYSWFEPVETAKRFDGGSPNVIGSIGMRESIEYLLRVGPENIENHDLGLASYLVDRLNEFENVRILSPLTENDRPKSAIISFTTDDIASIYEGLVEARFVVSLRLGAIRVAPHIYNSKTDIDQFIDKFSELTKKRR